MCGRGTVEGGSFVVFVELGTHVDGKSVLSTEVVFRKFGLAGVEFPFFYFLDHLMGG